MPVDTEIMFERQILPKISQGLKKNNKKEKKSRQERGGVSERTSLYLQRSCEVCIIAHPSSARILITTHKSTALGTRDGGKVSLQNGASEKVSRKLSEFWNWRMFIVD